MPTPGRVLMTRANEFIAAYCSAELLSKNYVVVGTVRRQESIQAVVNAHQSNPRLWIVVVADITSLTAYDDAIKGCDSVLHLAAPFSYAYNDLENDILVPSIEGTGSICRAASKESSVKMVVLTSSFAAVFDASKGYCPRKIYTTDDGSPPTYNDGNKGSTPVAYCAHRKLAEETTWKFVREKNPHWILVTLCRGMVLGKRFQGTL